MDKAPDAFRTISEVADYLETPAHVLRFWETRFPQVKPVKGAGGRRYYRPSDVALLAGIRRLLHSDGMTIRGVQKILRDQGVRHVAELGGEEVGAAEPLTALLPPARPEAEVVPLRPENPVLTRPPEMLAAGPRGAEPKPMPLPAPPAEDVPDLPGADFGAPGLAPVPDAPAPVPMPEAAAPDRAPPPTLAPLPPEPLSPALGGFGGFGLDLDAPVSGEGGFMAFSTPPGLTPPPAPPERPRRDPPRSSTQQPSLFDLSPPEDLGARTALTEDLVPEAPHIFVETPDEPAEITALPGPESLRAPEAEEGLLSAGFTDDLADAALDTPTEPPPAADSETISAEAAIQALLADAGEDVAAEEPQDLAADPETLDDSPGAPPATQDAAAPELAGLAPRLRGLTRATPALQAALTDLQARLGLLHAQMAEAAARPPRNPGA